MNNSYQEAELFLHILDPSTDIFVFQTFDDTGKNPALAAWKRGTLKQCWPWLQNANAKGAGNFVMVQSGNVRNNAGVDRIRCLFNENDKGLPKKYPIEPHMRVETSPGHIHDYFLSDELLLEDFAPIQARLIKDYGSDPNAKDLSRVLRLPGSINHKRAPFLVKLIKAERSNPYPRSAIVAAFPPYINGKVVKSNYQKSHIEVTPELINDLKTTLDFMSSDSRELWVAVGMALRELGDVGCLLWLNWSIKSVKYNPQENLQERFYGFAGSQTGYAGVFAHAEHYAAENGLAWVNPATMRAQSRRVDVGAVVWDAPVPADTESENLDLLLQSPMPDNAWHDFSSSGKPLATLENLKLLLNWYHIKCCYDVILRKTHIIYPITQALTDHTDESGIRLLQSLLIKNRIDKEAVSLLSCIFNESAINPIVDWITGTKWDGKSRLGEFYQTIKTPNVEYAAKMLRRWLIQCVAAADGAAHTPNKMARPKYELCLVLQGPQGTKKTSWVRRLVSSEYLAYVTDGAHLDTENKDSVKMCIASWITELGELDGTFKKDIAKLKSFFSKQVDTMRLPYAKTESHFQRRTSFCGSVNDEKFLVDSTGNRRFATLAIDEIDSEHEIDMQQLWAEVWESLYLKGESWWLTDEEASLRDSVNITHEVVDPVENALQTFFDLSDHGAGELLTCTQIVIQCGLPMGKHYTNSVSRVLTKYKFMKIKTEKGFCFYLSRNYL